MNLLDPSFGTTRLDEEELAYMTDSARKLLGDDPTRAAVYDLEQQLQSIVTERAMKDAMSAIFGFDDVLSDHFLRRLHSELFGEVWTWAGQQRRRETNIGVAPEHVGTQLRQSLDNLRYRFTVAPTAYDLREIGITTHAEIVRIHPFQDGNGRLSRLVADLVFIISQREENLVLYDWRVDRRRYIELLREYDRSRDASALTEFVPLEQFGKRRRYRVRRSPGLGK